MMLRCLLSALVLVRGAQALNQPHVKSALETKLIRRDGQKHLEIDQNGALEQSSQKHLATSQHARNTGRATLVPVLVRNDAQCTGGNVSMPNKDTKELCAAAVEAAGGTFMAYGTGDKAGACYQSNTASLGCPEGWETDSYDFYELQAPAVVTTNADIGGQAVATVANAFKFDPLATAVRARDPCSDLGCPEATDNCTYLTGATISMLKNNGTCAESETMVSLGDKDGNNGMVLDLVSCIAAVQQAILDPVPTCSDRFTQDSVTKECKCLAPAQTTCTPTADPGGTHCLWWMVYK